MKMIAKKDDNVILEKDDVLKIEDKIASYMVYYEDGTGQYIYKDDNVHIELIR